MLLQLENTNAEQIKVLLNFAKANKLDLKMVDETDGNYFLPGKPLTESEITSLIKHSRESGNITLEKAHSAIRKALNGG